MLPEGHLISAQGAWERHIEALHPGRLDPAPDRGLHNKAARLHPDNEQQFHAGWVQLLWQRGFQHSNPQVSLFRSVLSRCRPLAKQSFACLFVSVHSVKGCSSLSPVSLMTVQVQRFVISSFSRRDWSPDQLESQLSSNFVARIFLPAVTRPSTLIKGEQAILVPAHHAEVACTAFDQQRSG